MAVAVEWRDVYCDARLYPTSKPARVSLHLGCERCIHGYAGTRGVSCLCGWDWESADTCPWYDLKIHCLNGYTYGEGAGCRHDCHQCYQEFELCQDLLAQQTEVIP